MWVRPDDCRLVARNPGLALSIDALNSGRSDYDCRSLHLKIVATRDSHPKLGWYIDEIWQECYRTGLGCPATPDKGEIIMKPIWITCTALIMLTLAACTNIEQGPNGEVKDTSVINMDVTVQEGVPTVPVVTAAPATASICDTRNGICPMMVPIPVGSSCFCSTRMGPIAGIAR